VLEHLVLFEQFADFAAVLFLQPMSSIARLKRSIWLLIASSIGVLMLPFSL